MRFYIIAGEASGDLHAGNLMKELKILHPQAVFRGQGGDRMIQQGLDLTRHYKDTALMGFTEVLGNLKSVLKNIASCKRDISAFQPDAVILVDYPGFNLRMAEYAKKRGFRVYYYISPQVWAWHRSRVNLIKKYVDKMIVILPFEKEFFSRHNVPVEYVGHPLLDVFRKEVNEEEVKTFCERNNLASKPIIAILPGSRKQEVEKMLGIMLGMISEFLNYQFVIAGTRSVPEELYQKFLKDHPAHLVYDQTYLLLKNAKAALVKSGTATLETALLNVPQIVCYKGGYVSYQIAKRLVDVKYISLVNLIMGKEVVRELVQEQLNYWNIKSSLNQVLNDPSTIRRMLNDYEQLRIVLGESGASAKAASIILSDLHYTRN
ncbi:MAG: lipid-A-disaccharide synthase [Bacteroidetes bacterium]|nr:lipid-A-disaccharide synthase [Bacteroidota bacterium]